MKCHHPEVFCAPFSMRSPWVLCPAQIVRDAREHGVEVRPVCINASHWDCTLEPADDNALAVRLGMRVVRGLPNEDGARIVLNRAETPFDTIDDVWRRSRVPAASLRKLAEADAFRPALNLARRDAFWAIKALRDDPLPLFAAADARGDAHLPEIVEAAVSLKPMTDGREVVEDYGHTGLTLRQHPVAFLRKDLAKRRHVTCADANAAKGGRWVRTAGLVLVRQMPGSAKGVMFITLEDESGVVNLVVWPKMFEKFRRTVLGARMLGVEGYIQREGDVVHLIARKLHDLSGELASVGDRDAPFPLPHGRGDEGHHGGTAVDSRAPTPKPRDIYIPDLSLDALRLRSRNFR
jgi:error-prone DNA polymerase